MEKIDILLVDDEDNFRHTLAKRMGKRGFVPLQAANGEECLAILDKKPVDVVVLDIKMPGMNGIEVLHHIKEKYTKTEVILLTGHLTAADGVAGIKKGAFDYLGKPIELEHLLKKITQAYDKIKLEKLRTTEAEFREKIEQQMIATERLASLGTLAAGVAHEINNPLAIIKESAGWLKQLLSKKELADMPRSKDFKTGLDKIETAIERARKITHQLLGTVKKTSSVYCDVNLRELIEESVQLVKKEALYKKISINIKTDSSFGTIQSDPYQLRQILINLLINAIHATDTGGKVTVSLQDSGEQVEIKVSDTGTGIPKENLNKIFEPFFSTKPPGEGTGLGLFVTRGIIEKLGGVINLKSRVGHGTTFLFSIPKHFRNKE